jgi:hypothetical protein
MGTSRCIRRELFCLSHPPFPTQLRLEAMVERSCPAVQPVAPSFSVLKAHFLTRTNPRTPVKTLCGLTNDIGATGSCGAGPQGRAAASFRIRPKVQAVPPSSPGRIGGGISALTSRAECALPPWWADCTYIWRISYGRGASLHLSHSRSNCSPEIRTSCLHDGKDGSRSYHLSGL